MSLKKTWSNIFLILILLFASCTTNRQLPDSHFDRNPEGRKKVLRITLVNGEEISFKHYTLSADTLIIKPLKKNKDVPVSEYYNAKTQDIRVSLNAINKIENINLSIYAKLCIGFAMLSLLILMIFAIITPDFGNLGASLN